MSGVDYIEPRDLVPGQVVKLCYGKKDGDKPTNGYRYKKATVLEVYPKKAAVLLQMEAGYKTYLSYWHLIRMLNGRPALETEADDV